LPAVTACGRSAARGITPPGQRQTGPAIPPVRAQESRGPAARTSGSWANLGRTCPASERAVRTSDWKRGALIGARRRSGRRGLTVRQGRVAGTTGAASRGSRVLLRPLQAGDASEIVQLARASRVLHRSWVHPPGDPAAFRRYLRRSRQETVRTLVVVRREDGAIVGLFSLSQIFLDNFRSAYLGYWVGAPYAWLGYMREGMGLLLRYAFRRLKLNRVEANVQPENAASRALVRRTGFHKEGYSPRYLKIAGRWRDHERWAISVEDLRHGGRGTFRGAPRRPRG
jgi:[ribosomal protein S5]-alanine N-acetyltransferase